MAHTETNGVQQSDILQEQIGISGKTANDQHTDVSLAILAHELRNVLSPIQGGLDVLQFYAARSRPCVDAMKLIKRHMHHMECLINDLARNAGLSSPRFIMEKKREDVCAVLSCAIEVAMPHIKRKNHTLTVNWPSTTVFLYIDEWRIGQVFSNLLINAAKYTSPGGEIKVSIEKSDSKVIVSVEDNGIGLEQKNIPGIFDLFLRIQDGKNTEDGNGIGLALAKAIVEGHRGKIDVFSEGLGKGARFDVILPDIKAHARG